jgi:prophage DNA circulation protein
MSFRDRLRQASFRGVPFELEAEEHQGGRRKAVLEVPGRDEPFVQDLGRATQIVRLEALVIGADYDLRRDALLGALERPGTGELVHPNYGTRRASVTEAKVVWTNREQGLARFSITFVLNPTEIALGASVDGPSLAATASSSVGAAAQAAIEDGIGSTPSNVELTAARAASRQIGEELEDAVAASSRFQGLQDRAARVAALVRKVQGLSALTLRKGSDWAFWLNELQGSATDFGGSFSDRVAAFRGLLDLAQRIAGLGGTDSARRVQGTAATSTLAAATVAAADVGTGWDSRSEAIRAQEEVLEEIDAQLEVAPDALIGPLEDLRVAAVASIPAEDVELPELTTYTPAETEPAILASHQLYLTPDRGDEIAQRNRIGNPGFLPTEPLEVVVSV